MALNRTIANDHLMSDEEKTKYSDTPIEKKEEVKPKETKDKK